MNKEEIIQLIQNRINTEYKKYRKSSLDWAEVAAHKIYSSLVEKDIIKNVSTETWYFSIGTDLQVKGRCSSQILHHVQDDYPNFTFIQLPSNFEFLDEAEQRGTENKVSTLLSHISNWPFDNFVVKFGDLEYYVNDKTKKNKL